jgi:hypothetical protein
LRLYERPESGVMVNGTLPRNAVVSSGVTMAAKKLDQAKHSPLARTVTKRRHRAFAQILGKLYFFDLRENLRRILLDYGQKRSCTANAAFKLAC